MPICERKAFNPAAAVLDGLSSAALILPLALAMGACSEFGMSAALITAVVGSLLCPKFGFKPSYSAFAVVCAAVGAYSTQTAFIALFISGILITVFSFFKPERLKKFLSSPIAAGLMLGIALTMTVMQTTNYFGIGSTGDNVLEMLRSYRSLGFHANWRGVLYGTIVMVVMITYPRKFKKLSQRLSAPFVALVITLALNLFLNPVEAQTAINEVGGYCISDGFFASALFAGEFLGAQSLFEALICSMALTFVFLFNGIANDDEPKKRSYWLALGVSSGVGALLGSLPFCGGKAKSIGAAQAVISGAFSAALCAAVILLLDFGVARLPIHSLAVILIVGMWQSVDWHCVKLAFTSGAVGIFLFAAAVVCVLFLGAQNAVVIMAAICVANTKALRGKRPQEITGS